MADRDPRTGKFAPGHERMGGRPKGFSGLSKIVQERTSDGVELVEFALEVFRDPERTMSERMAAHAWLSDRGFGKPVQATDLMITTDVRPQLGAMTRDERMAWLKANRPDLRLSSGEDE